ncbi:hypothetical protein ASG35_13165 [Burkholderia sp. Leaf177]|nr:hypothetical protein ASG35_13165 [Burkholderia sp. Leaf177]
MGLARALGFDLWPRIAHLRDRRLHVPRHHAVPAELVAVNDCDVHLDLIESIWDEFVRVAASIQSGRCTAVEALTRFGAAARGQSVYDGGVHIGRLFRTVFLIDYFTDPIFRSELQHVLNRGEAVHEYQPVGRSLRCLWQARQLADQQEQHARRYLSPHAKARMVEVDLAHARFGACILRYGCACRWRHGRRVLDH